MCTTFSGNVDVCTFRGLNPLKIYRSRVEVNVFVVVKVRCHFIALSVATS